MRSYSEKYRKNKSLEDIGLKNALVHTLDIAESALLPVSDLFVRIEI